MGVDEYYPSGQGYAAKQAFRRSKKVHAWSAEATAKKSPEGYWREMDWNSAVALDIGAAPGESPGARRLRVVVSTSAWREHGSSGRQGGAEAWRKALVEAARFACTHIDDLRVRRNLGHLEAYWRKLAEATRSDLGGLAREAKLPMMWESPFVLTHPEWVDRHGVAVAANFERGSDGVLGVVGYVGTLKSGLSCEQVESALVHAKAVFENMFGRGAIASLDQAGASAWLPTQSEWHALRVGAEIEAGLGVEAMPAGASEPPKKAPRL